MEYGSNMLGICKTMPGTCKVYAWNMHGIRIEHAWDMLGRYKESAWYMHGVNVEHAWNMYDYAWNMQRICIV